VRVEHSSDFLSVSFFPVNFNFTTADPEMAIVLIRGRSFTETRVTPLR
jgi:hypothetical protein